MNKKNNLWYNNKNIYIKKEKFVQYLNQEITTLQARLQPGR